nr:reverse transcriptase domain-containing protein [Tanacetum cinerariifolium]
MMIQEFCPSHEMQKLESELWNHAMVEDGHAAYTDRFHELARLFLHLVTLESRMIKRYVYGLTLQICGMVAVTKPKTIQKAVQISSALTDEAIWNGSIKKVKKRINLVEIDKVIRGCKLEIKVHVFDIDLIPFGHESFDVIIELIIYLINYKGCSFFSKIDLRFIENFSKIAKPLTILTQKCKTFDWGEEQKLAFQTLKDKLCNAHVLTLPDRPKDFVVYCDASGIELGYVLMQR